MKKTITKRIDVDELVVFKNWTGEEFHVYVNDVGGLVIDSDKDLWIRPISKNKCEIIGPHGIGQ